MCFDFSCMLLRYYLFFFRFVKLLLGFMSRFAKSSLCFRYCWWLTVVVEWRRVLEVPIVRGQCFDLGCVRRAEDSELGTFAWEVMHELLDLSL